MQRRHDHAEQTHETTDTPGAARQDGPRTLGTRRRIGRGASCQTRGGRRREARVPYAWLWRFPSGSRGHASTRWHLHCRYCTNLTPDHLLSVVLRVYARGSDDGKCGNPNSPAVMGTHVTRTLAVVGVRGWRGDGSAAEGRPCRPGGQSADRRVARGRRGSWGSQGSPTSGQRRTVVTSSPFPTGTVTETSVGSLCRAST